VISHPTPELLAEWNAAEDQDPAIAKLRDLTVEYVTAQGGLTLDIWRLYMGHWFSTNDMMTTNEVAYELDISELLVINIIRSTDAVIIPRWRRTTEFRRSVRPTTPAHLTLAVQDGGVTGQRS
jgi:hypothetical protein